ncbi:hypothetical protein [Kitasatospora sp. GP82]|uniref:hypothetical protein n=1 Tax=Kitasatospora sp. GP82 TaxID=3035089 RepID=UPI00247473AB|nr:hypothetical protein [Kitasatospora sp. GP82]MDH6124740.1 hypothetical protein [Kitasatospora sp. GP82]
MAGTSRAQPPNRAARDVLLRLTGDHRAAAEEFRWPVLEGRLNVAAPSVRPAPNR